MALPNFRFYYWEANIRCIMLWSHFNNQADCSSWVVMELDIIKNFSIVTLLGSRHPSSSWSIQLPPLSSLSLTV